MRNLNLRIPTGCVYGFLGRNGAGKSTTIKMLTGMAPQDSGHVLLLGEEIANAVTENAIAHRIYSRRTSTVFMDDDWPNRAIHSTILRKLGSDTG